MFHIVFIVFPTCYSFSCIIVPQIRYVFSVVCFFHTLFNFIVYPFRFKYLVISLSYIRNGFNHTIANSVFFIKFQPFLISKLISNVQSL